jgi:hypothetical protein
MMSARRHRHALALAALLALALALSACGEGGEESTATTTSSVQAGAGEPAGAAGEAGKAFTPKPHTDSGGGSEQFQVKGADNSVQEYGTEAEGAEFEQVAAVLHGFLDARAAEEWAAACSYLAPGVVASLEEEAAAQAEGGERSCAAGLEDFALPAALDELRAEAAQADVGSVRVEGESGFVIYRALGSVYALAIARQGGEWKVAGLGGYPLL